MFYLYRILNIIPLKGYNSFIPIVENTYILNKNSEDGKIQRYRTEKMIDNNSKVDYEKGNGKDRLVQILEKANSDSNVYGKNLRVLIATRVANQGISLKNFKDLNQNSITGHGGKILADALA